jgi:saccharopine dehydrogenase-like NADP-dependent oxidoreductase
VTVADAREDALAHARRRGPVAAVRADLGDPAAVRALAGGYDLVVGALPGWMGLPTLRAVLEAGRPCVDVSFMPEDPHVLDGLSRAQGVTAVVDCGVAPGVSHMMVGHAAAALDECESVEILVGGLPRERRWPFDYKAGFSPQDVIEEYVRPARVVENGRVVVKDALSEPERIDFPGVGTLEAFNTDGLRTLLRTVKARTMREKTLRYPGHVELMRAFRDTGFFSKEPVTVSGHSIRPVDATAAVLFPRWTFEEGEEDLTVLRVAVRGWRGDEEVERAWDLLDRYDPATSLRSMSRTTAFPAASLARLVGRGALAQPGVLAPETIGALPGVLEHVLGELAARGVHVRARATARSLATA